MKSIFLALFVTGLFQIQPDYNIIVNGSNTSEYVYRDRLNTIVVQGAAAQSIRLSSPQAMIKRKGNTYTLHLKQDVKEIIVLVTYINKGAENQLGYYRFRVIDP